MKPKVEAQRELEALQQALKVDAQLLSSEHLQALNTAKAQLRSRVDWTRH